MRERDNNSRNSGREDSRQRNADASSGRNGWVVDNRNNRRGEDQTRRQPENNNFEDFRGNQEDRLNMMYDTSNYMGEPRQVNSGLPYGSENDLNQIGYYPQQGNPYQLERERYNTGYNPNIDNPDEGDMYRRFDSRGNHGYRHDASYGSMDEFRDFGDDTYGPRHID